jgi:hypothetical protein
LFWGLFVLAGVALNDRDKERALRLWLNYERPEQEEIVQWVVAEMKATWTDTKHTPRPHSALESQGWNRRAAQRIIPTPKQRGHNRGDELVETLRRRAQDRATSKERRNA